MAIVLGVVLLALALAAALVLAALAMRVPPPPARPVSFAPSPPSPSSPPLPAPDRVRLASRLLFARRSADAITLDCTLVRVDGRLPANVDPPVGLPFTLRVRCPDTGWFAGRVEELLTEWADDNRELVLELSPDRGKVRTTIASGTSSVHLELAGAAGLGSGLSSSS
ncbi:MAG TPA: hypothetical protein VF230_07020 [Acidimicrobiales bacterium]